MTVESMPRHYYDEKGAPHVEPQWKLVVQSKLNGPRTVEDTSFPNLALLLKHLSANVIKYEEAFRLESQTEFDRKRKGMTK